MKSLLATFCLAVFSLSLHATTYYVPDSTLSEAGLSTSLKSLVSSSITSAGGQLAGSAAAADFTLKPELVQLGHAYILTVTRFKGNEPLNSSRQKASSVEELDEAADRAVRATMHQTSTNKDVRVGEVQERDEYRLSRRTQSRHSAYFGLGPAGYANLGTSPLAYDIALGYNWEVSPYAMIRVLADLVTGDKLHSYYTSAQLGLNYAFTDNDNSPYIGALVGFGSAGTAARGHRVTTIGGFSGTLGAGWMFFRTASTQLDLFAGYSTIFGNNGEGAPGTYGLRVGVLF